MFFEGCEAYQPRQREDGVDICLSGFYTTKGHWLLVDWIHLVQDQKSEFTIANTLCGMPVRKQHPEGFDE
eukprot:3845094-Prorocentrum_lima.AAC.1